MKQSHITDSAALIPKTRATAVTGSWESMLCVSMCVHESMHVPLTPRSAPSPIWSVTFSNGRKYGHFHKRHHQMSSFNHENIPRGSKIVPGPFIIILIYNVWKGNENLCVHHQWMRCTNDEPLMEQRNIWFPVLVTLQTENPYGYNGAWNAVVPFLLEEIISALSHEACNVASTSLKGVWLCSLRALPC